VRFRDILIVASHWSMPVLLKSSNDSSAVAFRAITDG